ncbi:MAG: tetratricopeptide repeat protein [Kofleriaceae bacterium]
MESLDSDDLLDINTIDEVEASRDTADLQPPARMPHGTLQPVGDEDGPLAGLRAQAELHRTARAWDELARTLRRIIDIAELQDSLGEDEQIELYAELGTIEDEHLDHPGLAIDAWKKVLSVDGSEVRALTALEELFVRDERWDDAIDVLDKRALVTGEAAPLHRADALLKLQEKWPELVERLLERSETEDEAAPQIALLHQVAEIYEQKLDEAESAFYVLQAALNRDSTHLPTRVAIERNATDGGRWPELLEEYTKLATEHANADLWVATARGYRDHAKDLDSALAATQHALNVDAGHAIARGLLAELQRGQPLRQAAKIEQHDVAGAIAAYEQALAQEPDSEVAIEALERLYRRAEAWQPLVDLLARRAGDDADVLFEIASIYDERMGNASRAIGAYRRVIELEPHNRLALRSLETLYDKTEQHDQYIAVLEAQLAFAGSDADRISIYEKIAAAYDERFGSAEQAADAYERILSLDGRNVAAYRLLARMYRQSGSYEALIETYHRQISSTADVDTRVELWVAIGEACEQLIQDSERAIDAYNAALALDGVDEKSLHALGRLYEQSGEWERAVDMLQRQDKTPELCLRIGQIHYRQIGDASAAEASLLRGLAMDPAHSESMTELIAQYADRGDWQKAAQMMTRAEQHAPVAVEKVRLLYGAADIYMHRLRVPAQAKQLYAAVIALDPEHVEAGVPLAEIYWDARDWSQLSPVIEMLARKQPDVETYSRAARCAKELGDSRRALDHYKAAFELDHTHLPTLIGRADLSFDEQQWETAGKLYQTILVQHRETQREAEVVRIYGRLGDVRRAMGDRHKALHMYEKALELDPRHRDSLHAVVEIQQDRGDWEAVVRAKRGLLEIADAKDKLKLHDDIATVYRDRLRNPQKATAGYLEALEMSPDDRQLLQKLLDLHIDSKQYRKAVEIMERFIALETDTFKRGLYYHAAATVCRDELKALDEAVDYYNCALDSFFSQSLDEEQLARALMSFEAIDRVLTTKRDWKAQELAYRDMIKRLPKGQYLRLQVSLVDGLAEIYRSRLKQYEAAAGAFEIAQQLDPDGNLRAGADRAEILAELYGIGGTSQVDKAIAQHTIMLQREPFKYDSYRALLTLYRKSEQWDKVWCLCDALRFLKKAEPDEVDFAERYRPRGLVRAASSLGSESWAKLAHPEENRYISAIFAACGQGVAAMKAAPHKAFGIKPEDKRQLEGDPLLFSKLFLYLAQVLRVPTPDVYLVDDAKGTAEIQLANTKQAPSFVVRPHLLQGKTEREVAYLLARRLVSMRPEYYLRMLLTTNTELKVVVLSAIAMLQPRFPVPPNMVDTVAQYLPALQKSMQPHALEQLGIVVQRFIQTTPEINLQKWAHAVDATQHRAAFALTGDLDLAARMLAQEPVVVDGPSAKEKVKQLMLFAISEDYFAIRTQLGLTIG